MKYALTLSIAFLLPGLVSAAGLVASPNGIEYAANITVSNSGSIESSTKSSASTGGNTVGSGGSVQTGSASASSHSEVVSDQGGTSVKVKVETETNGEKTVREYENEFEPGESVDVKIEAKSSTQGGTMESDASVQVNGEEVETTTEEDGDSGDPPPFVFLQKVAEGIKNAVTDFFDLFW